MRANCPRTGHLHELFNTPSLAFNTFPSSSFSLTALELIRLHHHAGTAHGCIYRSYTPILSSPCSFMPSFYLSRSTSTLTTRWQLRGSEVAFDLTLRALNLTSSTSKLHTSPQPTSAHHAATPPPLHCLAQRVATAALTISAFLRLPPR